MDRRMDGGDNNIPFAFFKKKHGDNYAHFQVEFHQVRRFHLFRVLDIMLHFLCLWVSSLVTFLTLIRPLNIMLAL